MSDLQSKLKKLIDQATGKIVYSRAETDEGVDVEMDDESNLDNKI